MADIIGVSVDTLNNYKKLTELIPELIDLVDTGIVTPTTALSIVKNMSLEEQEEFISAMDITKKITQKQTQQYIKKIKELESQEPEVIEKVIDNTDYSSIEKNKKLQIELEKIKKEKEDLQSTNRLLEMSKKSSENMSESYKKLSEEYKKQSEEYMEIKNKIIDMGLDPNGEYNLYSAASEIAKLTNEIEDLLINKLAPIRYKNFMIALKNSNILRNNFRNTLDMVNDWYLSMNEYVNSNLENENKNNVIDMEEI
jgi:exonuclease VII large subunit